MFALKCVRCSFVKVMPVGAQEEEKCNSVKCWYNRPNAAGVVLMDEGGQG